MGDWKRTLARIIVWSPVYLFFAVIASFITYEVYRTKGWVGLGLLAGLVLSCASVVGAWVGSIAYLVNRASEEDHND